MASMSYGARANLRTKVKGNKMLLNYLIFVSLLIALEYLVLLKVSGR